MSDEIRATPLWKEDHISQIPSLQLLQNLGWEYLTHKEALKLRQERKSAVILEGILTEQLRKRRFSYREELRNYESQMLGGGML